MAIKIAHSSISEKGTINGSAGDQTGKEVCIRTWYNFGYTRVYRPKSSAVASHMVNNAIAGANNDNIGYSQYGDINRNSVITQAEKVGYDLSRITTKCNSDCSSYISCLAIGAGVPKSLMMNSGNACTTRTIGTNLIASGMFTELRDSKYLDSDAYLKAGDILVRSGKHVVIAIENGSKAGSSTSTSSSNTSSSSGSYYAKYTGNTGSIVTALNSLGIDSSMTNRKKIAIANNISNYSGTANQNITMLNLLKQGKLKKAGSTASSSSSSSSSNTSSSSTSSSNYVVGKNYTTQVELNVRTGAGTNYPKKTHSQLTTNAKKYDKDKDGAIDKGTTVTCKEVKKVGSDIWMRIPSGWICAVYKGKIYVK